MAGAEHGGCSLAAAAASPYEGWLEDDESSVGNGPLTVVALRQDAFFVTDGATTTTTTDDAPNDTR
jgi:hypothetical protein